MFELSNRRNCQQFFLNVRTYFKEIFISLCLVIAEWEFVVMRKYLPGI